MIDDFIVTLEHLHSVPDVGGRTGYCHRGARQFFNRYQLDWAAFVQTGGISANELLATGDALAIKLVEHARRIENGR